MKSNKSLSLPERICWVKIYLRGERSLRSVASEAGVSHQTLNTWVKEILKDSSLRSEVMPRKSISPLHKIDPRDLEIQRLRAQLEHAELKAHALDTMITIAEKELKISIRKKSGAKQ